MAGVLVLIAGRRRLVAAGVVLAVALAAGIVLAVVQAHRKPARYGAVDCGRVSAELTSGLAALRRSPDGPPHRYDQECLWSAYDNPGVGLEVRTTTRFTPPGDQEPPQPWDRAAAREWYDKQLVFPTDGAPGLGERSGYRYEGTHRSGDPPERPSSGICTLIFMRANLVVSVTWAWASHAADALPDPDCRRRVVDVGRDVARHARI